MSSECPEFLVCDAPITGMPGVCRVECVAQRECILGAHCVLEAPEVGSCLVDQPLDHATSPCNGTGRACPDGQVCRDFTCWNACTTNADCTIAGSWCRAGACVNPGSPGSAYGTRQTCSGDAECGPGRFCASSHGSQRVCRTRCTADADCSLAEHTPICAAIDDPMVPAGTMACVIGCDPVRQLGCQLTDHCEVNQEMGVGGAMRTFFECRGPGGGGGQGSACGTTTPMFDACGGPNSGGPGLTAPMGCSPTSVDPGHTYECRRFCVTSGDCHDASYECTGPLVEGIQNADVAGAPTFHVCQHI
jgi:hypothetical protein